MSSNVTPISMSGGSDDGGDYGERLTRLETKVENMAAREDLAKVQTSIAEIKTLIVQREASMLRWLLGILITTAAGMVTVLIRSFFF